MEECANLFAALDDPYFEPAPRTSTIGDRVFRALSGDSPAVTHDRTDVVLVGKMVSVSDIAQYAPTSSPAS